MANTLAVGWHANAQPMAIPEDNFWRVNGTVYSISVISNLAYLGGSFTYVGPPSGNAGWADLNTGTVIPGFPELKGQIYCVLPDGQGGWFVGGKFVESDSQLQNLVQIQANHAINRSWTPNPDNTVYALALSADHLYVAGDFTQISAATRSYLVSLNPQTAKTNNWVVRCQNTVRTLALAGDTLYLGGQFTSLNSQSRQRLGALEASTGTLKEWNPGLSGGNSLVNVLAIDGSLVYVGGDFTSCGTKPRNRIAAVDATTGVANNWNPNASASSGTASINSIAIVGNVVYVGGWFSSIGGRNRNHLAALSKTTGQADANWDPSPNAQIQTLLPVGNDLLVGGSFTTITNANRSGFAALDRASGTLKDLWINSSSLRSGVAITVTAVAEQNGTLAIGGDFLSFGGVERKYLAALDLDTGRPTSWNPGADKDVYELLPGNTVLYVGGAFNNIGGTNIARLAAVNLTDGQVVAWNPKSSVGSSHWVFTLALVTNRLFVGGQFTSMGGLSRNNLAELSTVDALATTWDPSPQGNVRSLLVYSNMLYVAGEYYSIAGGRAYLNAFGLEDHVLVTTFNPQPDAAVRALALHENRLFVGGDFTQIAGQSRSRLAAISPDLGQETDLWNPEVGVTGQLRVYTIAPMGNTIYAGGNFTAVGGEYRKSLAGLNTAMSSATGWDPSPNGVVWSVVLAGNRILVGGDFTAFGARSWPYFAVFSGQPNILPGSTKIKPNGNVEMKVADGNGYGSNLLIQAADGLEKPAPTWQTIQTLPIFGWPTPVEDTQAAGKPRRFYRLVIEP